MTKNDIKKLSILIEWKLSTSFELSKLKAIKEEISTEDVTEFAKQVFDVLKLEAIYKELGIDIPDFTELDKEDGEDITEANHDIHSVNFYKWL